MLEILQAFDQILGFLKENKDSLAASVLEGREGVRRRAKIISEQLFALGSLAQSSFLNSQNVDTFISSLAWNIF